MLRYFALLVVAAQLPSEGAVDFNRDIRPLLSDRCFSCHGPDAASRNIKLRLDSEAGMTADLGGRRAVTPGSLEQSELIQRITTENKARRMPPVSSGLRLSPQEIELLKNWVKEGARWQTHWSWIRPERPLLPPVKNSAWPRNAIDFFVLHRLEREGLVPSPQADPYTLIRRVTLDLTGVPPTPEEVDAFVKDPSPAAYEKLVDRLLASPRYGERMAARWLDVARYADTNGYQTDAERVMWRWRDWVIDAFNRNMPFDQFTIEQLAGDLLPNPTLEQRIATGFNRNHRGNGEGGIIPEEYAVEYVADRVETMATAWLGLTAGCARCHSHKYDPISQKEYYQLFAFFNNINERGRYFKYGNTPPLVLAPTREQQELQKKAEAKLAAAEANFAALKPRLETLRRSWEQTLAAGAPSRYTIQQGLARHFDFEKPEAAGQGVSLQPGRFGLAAHFDGKGFLEAGKIREYGFYSRFTLSAWIRPTAADGAILTRAKDISEETGLGLYLKDGKLQLNLVQRWLDDAIRVETESAIPLQEWTHVAATYDGTRVADGVRLYVNGKPQPVKVLLDELNQDFRAPEPWRVGGGNGLRFQGWIDEVRIYDRNLPALEIEVLALDQTLEQVARVREEERSLAQREFLQFAFLETYGPEEIRQAWRQLVEARQQRDQLVASFPTVMVMEEMTPPRPAYFLHRGAYDRPGERVERGVPTSLHPWPAGAPKNRLGLAQWIVSPDNPLTARVIVNRFWQSYFGTGIVKTVEDFGSQGEWPSHPELLDWLAREFIESGWNVKAMQKLIVMSATYRQSAKASRALLERDPENRLLARGPRVRLPAETVRDQALAAAGLLVERIGGPSVKPYQPAGLWRELAGGNDYQQDRGEGLYRRSLYTFWKRTAPPPMMVNFDASSRETCVVRETRTNTPLQALNLMNDVTYLEAARKLAERMIREGGASAESRLQHGFRLVLARLPRARELEVLKDSLRFYLDHYQTHVEAAGKLLEQGDAPRPASLEASELAAYAAVASMILNLDEVVTKP
ncbi:MAG: DUF1553 domain-containing protein [Bryobacteraceae bacterium]|nr:DUF1553 domain-containing protein [Bryobacteraceae bacterium]MDW8378600.1 DUF1553 domain-containing protein [Bryobacterales bacterium]